LTTEAPERSAGRYWRVPVIRITETAMRKDMMVAVAIVLTMIATPAVAQQRADQRVEQRTKVMLNLLDDKGIGAAVGSVTFSDTPKGLQIEAALFGLPPGPHGFHVHEHPSCGPQEKDGKIVPGLAAGDHYDPGNTRAHRGPEHKDGHLGDLPELVVEKDGVSNARMLAPHLKVADLRGRSLVIHAGGDNYADTPQPAGGGGDRIACGLFEIKMAE
jgi:superoxide dismutase, Cu-Zn family